MNTQKYTSLLEYLILVCDYRSKDRLRIPGREPRGEITIKGKIRLSLLERFYLLFGGSIEVETLVVSENSMGKTDWIGAYTLTNF